MPHARMEMHDALIEANGWFRDYDPSVVLASENLDDLAARAGLSSTVRESIARLHPAVQSTVHAAIQAAAADVAGARPVYLSWRHGPIQRVQVTAPGVARIPLDICIESGYVEDGLGLPDSTA